MIAGRRVLHIQAEKSANAIARAALRFRHGMAFDRVPSRIFAVAGAGASNGAALEGCLRYVPQ